MSTKKYFKNSQLTQFSKYFKTSKDYKTSECRAYFFKKNVDFGNIQDGSHSGVITHLPMNEFWSIFSMLTSISYANI